MKTLLRSLLTFAFTLALGLGLSPQVFSLSYGPPSFNQVPVSPNPIWVYYVCVDESGHQVDCAEEPPPSDTPDESPPPEESDEPEEVPEEPPAELPPPAETPDVVNQVTPSDPLYLEGSGSLFSGCTLHGPGSHNLLWNSLIFGALVIGVRMIRTLLRSD